MKNRALLAIFSLCLACSTPAQTPIEKDGVPAEVSDSVILPEVKDEPAPPEILPELQPDQCCDEDLVPECQPGDGCFGDPCETNLDCLSGFCLDHLGNSICTSSCVDECPAGFSCRIVDAFGADLLFLCVSDFRVLCRPCVTNSDCLSASGDEDLCLDYGDEGNFCGASCGAETQCPQGYDCVDMASDTGSPLFQCKSVAGTCQCSEKSVQLGLFTECEKSNDLGGCAGHRTCTADGLSACDAMLPSEEECNEADDDCDGDIDEDTCDDDNVCTTDTCTGLEGCQYENVTGTNCDDGDVCSVTDHCDDGTCVGTKVACDDGNLCTDDFCDGLQGCVFEPNDEPCDDGDQCTIGDECSGGVCGGIQVSCQCLDDGDCAQFEDEDLCNGTLYCDKTSVEYQCKVDPDTVVECAEAEGLDAPCLEAVCDSATSKCGFAPAHDAFACDDGDACTFGEACLEGQCLGGQPLNCNDGESCTIDECDPDTGCIYGDLVGPCTDLDACTVGDICQAGECEPGLPANCDDGNVCTDDSCAFDAGCQHTANQAACDDGNQCTTGDHCADAACVFTDGVDCDDGNQCTKDSCTPAGGCLNEPLEGACTDDDACTINDYCAAGVCVGGLPLNCDDGNVCTDDSCGEDGLCQHDFNGADCDDGNLCTDVDLCVQGKCKGTSPPDCDDKDVCTTDSCDPEQGCVYVLNTSPCDDLDTCTTGDACDQGVCKGTGQLECNDNNVCTDDTCDAGTGCVFTNNLGGCDDGNACTTGDQCSAGKCAAGGAKDCNDDNVCTEDSCNPQSGCLNKLLTGPACNDGEPCTSNDACIAGACEGGGPTNCNDNNVCTDDSCLPGQGCQNLPNIVGCDDNNACTVADVCANGQCQPGTPLVCNDNDHCTTNTCQPATGCVYPPDVPCCGNGQKEAGEQCDDGNIVSNDGCSADCKSEMPQELSLFPDQVLECGPGYVDNEDHSLGSGYACNGGDDLEVFRSSCTSCEQGGKTSNGLDLEFKPNLGNAALITKASLLIRAVPDDGCGIMVNVFDYETGAQIGKCSIGPGSQVYYECTAVLSTDLLEKDTIRIYTNSSPPQNTCDYMIYDFVKLNLEYKG